MGALLVFPAFALYILNSVWVAIVFGILSTRFRDIGQLLTTSVQLVFFADADHLVRRRFEQHDARVVEQAQDRRDQPDVPLS